MKQGTLLATLDAGETRAQVQSSTVQLALEKQRLERAEDLFKKGFSSQQSLDEQRSVHARAAAKLKEDQVRLAFSELGLDDWLDGLPAGLDTRVGQRGEALSVGERQLVSLARAYVANPTCLLLDEATSAVDPGTETRIARALESLSRGRTSITIAHRLSTAERADRVLVMEGGRLVEHGPHAELVEAGGAYAGLYRSWMATTA